MTADPSLNGPPAVTGIARAQMPALVIGVLGLLAAIAGWFLDQDDFYRAWLPAFMFWFMLSAGALAVLMLQYVTGGEWGVLIRRPLGAAARTIWMFLLFIIPIWIGLEHIYPWANAEVVAHNQLVAAKTKWWLNRTGWTLRAAVYFALWILWAWRVRRLSLEFYEDRSPDTDATRRKWAAAGLLMIVLTLTLASVDWMMSLEPEWFSSMYGISFIVGCGLTAFAFVTFFLTQISDTRAMRDVLKPMHFRDLGNLMLAFTMLWAYTAFSQFLLIWYANVKEEIPYYLRRMEGGWGAIAVVLIVFHFFLPFSMLLMRGIKDRPKTIAVVTVLILVMRFVDIYWLSAPSWSGGHFQFHWITLAAFAGIGGVWLWAFIQQLKGQTIIPIHETWVEEAIREGAVKINA